MPEPAPVARSGPRGRLVSLAAGISVAHGRVGAGMWRNRHDAPGKQARRAADSARREQASTAGAQYESQD